jgi:hypothetical protein
MRLSTPLATLLLTAVVALDAQQAPALRIIVLAGEAAVNIIQQKTAVSPLVEIRDRNNLPVAGATVTFSIGGGGSGAAFAGGAQTLTVTTNAVGQAAASGLNAISSGALQIQVQAAYQGQLATAAISQTNFATAAAAAQAGAGASSGGTATGTAAGAAGGGGGGLSATTIGIVGAVVGGGALAATQVGGRGSDAKVFDVYTGSVSGQLIFTSRSVTTICVRTMALAGSMSIELTDGGTSGTASLQVTQTQVALTGPCNLLSPPPLSLIAVAVTGGPSALTFTEVGRSSAGGTTGTTTTRFTGSLSGTTISGTVSIDIVEIGSTVTPDAGASGSTTFQVTLQK